MSMKGSLGWRWLGAISVLAMTSCSAPSPAPSPDSNAYTSRVPPARPSGAARDGKRRWYAIDSVRFGTKDPKTGATTRGGWKDVGFDLDARNTTAEMSASGVGSCKRVGGSPSKVLADGNGGIDNNFGQHVVTILQSLKSDVEGAANRKLTSGKLTWLLRIDQVPDDLGDNPHASGALFATGSMPDGAKPTFTESDDWPVLSSSVDSGSIDRPLVTFPDGYIAKGVWVSGAPNGQSFTLDFGTDTMVAIPVDAPLLAVSLDGSNGTIAGVVSSSRIETMARPILMSLGSCTEVATGYRVDETLRETMDVVLGAPQLQDETRPCDAMSLGIGFTMKPTHAPTRVVAAPVPPLCRSRVFVSSQVYSKDFGGVAGADAACQSLADAASLGGKFRAWMSDSKNGAKDRLSPAVIYELVDGTRVATTWMQLTKGDLKQPINRTEKGGTPAFSTEDVGPTAVWTATTADGVGPGSADKTCNDWSATGGEAMLGSWASSTATWTENASAPCQPTTRAAIYCFEQP